MVQVFIEHGVYFQKVLVLDKLAITEMTSKALILGFGFDGHIIIFQLAYPAT